MNLLTPESLAVVHIEALTKQIKYSVNKFKI